MTPPGQQETVAVVVDCCFGHGLRDLASSGMALWVLDSGENRAVLEDVASEPSQRPGAMTTFKVASRETSEEAFIRILPTIDLHHNALASEPPYAAVEVFGVTATPAIREVLREFKLTVVEETASHFRAEMKAASGAVEQ